MDLRFIKPRVTRVQLCRVCENDRSVDGSSIERRIRPTWSGRKKLHHPFGALRGTAGAALYTFKQPGVYAYVNHNLIEAVMKGAVGHFKIEGKWDDNLMKQVKAPTPIK